MSYSNRFQSEQSAKDYEGLIYKEKSYDSFLWSIQYPFLRKLVSEFVKNKTTAQLKHLDFACGTGRIIGDISDIFSNSVGIDVSSSMIKIARGKYPDCEFRVGDILKDPEIAEYDYDVITAFRFFLNAEPDLRKSIIKDLSSRLKNSNSLLIFNIHGFQKSIRTFAKFFHKEDVIFNEMSYREVMDLINHGDLEVIQVLGFGFFPRRLYYSPVKPLITRLEKQFSNQYITNQFGSDLIFVCKRKY